MLTCAVISCDSSSHSKDVNLFRVPIDHEDAKGWVDFIAEANSGILPRLKSGRLFVCSKHFRRCCVYPCNPRRKTLIAGHYPSVVDGKVIVNVESKCALISADEKLEPYKKPACHNPVDKQRDYLVQKLTSFGVQRKIVIGTGSAGTLLKRLNSAPTSISPEKVDVKMETARPVDYAYNLLELQYSNTSVESDNESVNIDNKIQKETRPLNQNPSNCLVKVETVNTLNRLPWTSKSIRRTTRPSAETKIRLLSRDNANLKKSVCALQKRVTEMEKDMKRFKEMSRNAEKRNSTLLKGLQKKLNQKTAKGCRNAGTSTTLDFPHCKCALIEVVDISED